MTETPTRKQKLLFWLLLAAYSTFFAEVFAGSDMFPFFNTWGLLIVLPLYGLHSLLLLTLIYRAGGRPTFPALILAGVLFGLYEAYMTKMLWNPAWGAAVKVADIAVIELLVLLWWHTWFSFIVPLVLAERLLTGLRDVLNALPPRLQGWLGSWRGYAWLGVFGGLFQSVNSPDPGRSFLSAASTVSLLLLLTLIWRRWVARGVVFSLPALLPGARTVRWLALWLAALYLFLGFSLSPENIPAVWPGQVLVWMLYALVGVLLSRTFRRTRRVGMLDVAGVAPDTSTRWLLPGLVFILVNTFTEALLPGAGGWIALTGWSMGILFYIWLLRQAWQSYRVLAA